MSLKVATVNSSLVPATQSNFVAYVNLTRVGITTTAEANSVRVYLDILRSVEIPRHIVSASQMWVCIPTLTQETTLYIDYDGVRADYAVTDPFGRNAVYSQGNIIVATHHEEVSGDRVDSAGNDNLTDTNTVTQSAGRIGNCSTFLRANSERLVTTTANVPSGDVPLEMRVWHRTSLASTYRVFSSLVISSSFGPRWFFEQQINNSDNLHYAEFGFVNGTNQGVQTSYATPINDGNWHYCVVKIRNTGGVAQLKMYVDGVLRGTNNHASLTYSLPSNFISYTLGATRNYADGVYTHHVTGDIDSSSLVVNRVTDDNYTLTEYNNQNFEDTFWGAWVDTLTSDLLEHWSLNGTRSGSLNSITISAVSSGASTENNGVIGSCFSYNAAVGVHDQFTYNSAIPRGSISFWYRGQGDGPGTAHRVIGKTEVSVTDILNILFGNHGRRPYLEIQDIVLVNETVDVMTRDLWYHHVITWNGSVVKWYINGVERYSVTSSVSIAANTTPFTIGGWTGNSTQQCNGDIDELSFYLRDLTPFDVARLYNNGYGYIYPQDENTLQSPTVHWLLDETTGNRVDTTGSYTLVQTGTVNSDVGLSGNGALFTGSAGSYLSIADNAVFRWGKNTRKGLAFWVKFNSVTGVQTVIGKWGAGGEQDWIVYSSGTSLLVGAAQNGSVLNIATLAVGEWFLVVINFYEDNTIQAYTRRIGFTLSTFAKTSVGAGTVTAHVDLRLGNNSGSNPFSGVVDTLYWLDGNVIDLATVSTLYNILAPTNPPQILSSADKRFKRIEYLNADRVYVATGTTTSLSFDAKTGSRRGIVVNVHATGADLLTSATYNGVPLSLRHKYKHTSVNEYVYVLTLPNPASGVNTLQVNFSSATEFYVTVAAYNNVNQTHVIDTSTIVSVESATSPISAVITPKTPGSWVGAACGMQRAATASAGVTARVGNNTAGVYADTASPVTGSPLTVTFTVTSPIRQELVVYEILPFDYSLANRLTGTNVGK